MGSEVFGAMEEGQVVKGDDQTGLSGWRDHTTGGVHDIDRPDPTSERRTPEAVP